jgi:signal transduction histidine kinase
MGNVAAPQRVHETRDAGEIASSSRGPRDLMSVVCHDLRSPLSSIVMGLALLRRSLMRLEGMASEKRVAESAVRSADRLAALISDLDEFTQLEAGTLEVEARAVEVDPLVARAIEAHRAAGEERQVTLALRSAPTLASVSCDGARVLGALRQLLENAVRYAPANGTVHVDVEVGGGRAVFAVTDDGPGMSEAQVSHAFDARWHAGESPRDGTGLGLALVQGIAAAHGGGAAVESRLGGGTRASFWLPAAGGPA